MHQNKRVNRRITTSLEVYWKGNSNHDEGRITSLSIKGCLIETARRVSIGELLSFEAQLSTGSLLPLEGRVMYRSSHPGFGVLFTPLSEEQKRAIYDLIEQ